MVDGPARDAQWQEPSVDIRDRSARLSRSGCGHHDAAGVEDTLSFVPVIRLLSVETEFCVHVQVGQFAGFGRLGFRDRIDLSQHSKYLRAEPDVPDGFRRRADVDEARACQSGSVLWESVRICVLLLSGCCGYPGPAVEHSGGHPSTRPRRVCGLQRHGHPVDRSGACPPLSAAGEVAGFQLARRPGSLPTPEAERPRQSIADSVAWSLAPAVVWPRYGSVFCVRQILSCALL